MTTTPDIITTIQELSDRTWQFSFPLPDYHDADYVEQLVTALEKDHNVLLRGEALREFKRRAAAVALMMSRTTDEETPLLSRVAPIDPERVSLFRSILRS